MTVTLWCHCSPGRQEVTEDPSLCASGLQEELACLNRPAVLVVGCARLLHRQLSVHARGGGRERKEGGHVTGERRGMELGFGGGEKMVARPWLCHLSGF